MWIVQIRYQIELNIKGREGWKSWGDNIALGENIGEKPIYCAGGTIVNCPRVSLSLFDLFICVPCFAYFDLYICQHNKSKVRNMKNITAIG